MRIEDAVVAIVELKVDWHPSSDLGGLSKGDFMESMFKKYNYLLTRRVYTDKSYCQGIR